MATLTVRNLPDSVIERLKALAARNKRSMEQEARSMIEAVSLDRVDALERIEAACSLQARETNAEEVQKWLKKSRP